MAGEFDIRHYWVNLLPRCESTEWFNIRITCQATGNSGDCRPST